MSTRLVSLLIMLSSSSIAICAESDVDTTLWIEGVEYANSLSDDLVAYIPNELKYFKESGLPNGLTDFGAYVVPLSDSNGHRIDSQCIYVTRLLVLYTNYMASKIVLFKYQDNYVEKLWGSPKIDGHGFVYLQDLNNDRLNEIIVRLNFGTHAYENVYILAFTGDSLRILNPSNEIRSFSEFRGFVGIDVSDTGTVIKAYHPAEGTRRTYLYRKNSAEFELVSEAAGQNED